MLSPRDLLAEDYRLGQIYVSYYIDFISRHESDFERLWIEQQPIISALELAQGLGMREDYLRGVIAFCDYLEAKGEYSLAISYLQVAETDARGRGDDEHLPEILLNLGRMTRNLGAYDLSKGYLTEALSIAQATDKLLVGANATRHLGYLAYAAGDLEQAKEHWSLGQQIANDVKNAELESAFVQNLGLLEDIQGNYSKAIELFQRSLELAKAASSYGRMSAVLQSLGLVTFNLGDYEEARRFLSEALAMARKQQDLRNLLYALNTLSSVEYRLGRLIAARDLCIEALQLVEQSEYSVGKVLVLTNLGDVQNELGNHTQARDDFVDPAYLQAVFLGYKESELYALVLKGVIALDIGGANAAEQHLLIAKMEAEELGHKELECAANLFLGRAYIQLGLFPEAALGLQHAFVLATELSHSWYLSLVHNSLGDMFLAMDSLESAERSYEQALDMARKHGTLVVEAFSLFGLAQVTNYWQNTEASREKAKASHAIFKHTGHFYGEVVEEWIHNHSL